MINFLRTALSLPQYDLYVVVDSNGNHTMVHTLTANDALEEASRILRCKKSQCRVKKVK